MTPRVLLVGGGLTSAMTSHLLREELQAHSQLLVFDKARGAGGRMSTSRGPTGCGSADLGAQYITVTSEFQEKHSAVYSQLTAAGLLTALPPGVDGMKQFPAGTKHLVAPKGISSLVKYFFQQADVTPQFQTLVEEVSVDTDGVTVSASGGKKEKLDAVVLTMPIPQLLALRGNLISKCVDSNNDVKKGLESVQYSSRYALALFFDQSAAIQTPWCARYIYDHPVFRYVALDNQKRGQNDQPTSVVLHTNVAFGVKHVEMTPDEVQPILERHVTELFPDWPTPAAVKCQKWRYSQVTDPFPGSPGHVVLSADPLVVAAGDAFSRSTMDGCITSARSTAKCVAEYLNGKNGK